MKYKTYKYGNYTCKSYYKKAGYGYEVGFYYGEKPIFVGNFVYQQEAKSWYGIMNREIAKFAKKYTAGYKLPFAWFSNFIRNHLYKYYYAYLDKLFARYTRQYDKAYARDYKQYVQKKKYYSTGDKAAYLKAV